MKWNKKNLERHFDKHPQREPCWREALGHDVTIGEYESESLKTAGPRSTLEYRSVRIQVDFGEVFEEPETRTFIDGFNFITIADETYKRIKTHYHFHVGGERARHQPGSTAFSQSVKLDQIIDDLEAKTRSGLISQLTFESIAETVAPSVKNALKDLEK